MNYDVFISHSSKDHELSEKICEYLEGQGIKCWIAPRNVTGHYARSIMEGIEQSELMVLVYSGKANNSSHVENEIDNAFCLGKMIIPFRIEGIPYSNVLRYYLNKSHYVDGMPEPLASLEQLRDQIKRNMSEQRHLEDLDNAFRKVSEWAGIDVNLMRESLKRFKNRDAETVQQTTPEVSTHGEDSGANEPLAGILPEQQTENFQSEPEKKLTPEEEEAFNQVIDNFIQTEFGDSADTGCNEKQEGENQDPNAQDGAGRYDILQNAAGDLLIIIKYHEGDPENPRIVFDGTDSALLYRSKQSAIFLDGINQNAGKALMNVEDVLVVEVKDDDVAREYKVPLRKIKSLRSLY